MITAQEYQDLKRKLAEEYQKDMEALDRVYRITGSPAMLESPGTDPVRSPVENNAVDSASVDSQSATTKKGDLIKAVRDAVSKMASTFTILTVAKYLKSKGIEAKKTSIRPTLSKLQMKGEIEIVTQGIGRSPTIYKRKLFQAATKGSEE